MKEAKARFLNGLSVNAADLLALAEYANVKIAKNIANQIDNKVEHIKIIYDNGASQISGYGLRTNTTLAIAKVIRNVYQTLKTA